MYNVECNAGMAELADAYGSGPYESNFMEVRVLLPAPFFFMLNFAGNGKIYLLMSDL